MNGDACLICAYCGYLLLVGAKVLVKKPSGDLVPPIEQHPGWQAEMDVFDNKIWTIARSDGAGYLEFEEDTHDNWSFAFSWCELQDQCICPSLLYGHLNNCNLSKKKP